MTQPIFDQLTTDLRHAGIHLTGETGHVRAWLHQHTRPTRYRQQQTPEGDTTMSLTTIVDALEHPIADLRQVATYIDQDPIFKGAARIAADVAPEIRAAAADLLPGITALPLPAIRALAPIIDALAATQAPAAAAPAAPAAPAPADPQPAPAAQ